MAKSIPEVKIGNEVYQVKDRTAREHLVEVSQTQPTSEDNKLWIKNQEAEYEVPTIDEHNQLKSALVNKVRVLFADLEQGSFDTNGMNSNNNKSYRVRTKGYYQIVPGKKYVLKVNGFNNLMQTSVSFYSAADFSTARGAYTDWYYRNEFIVPTGMNYCRILIKYPGNNVNITPSNVDYLEMEMVDYETVLAPIDYIHFTDTSETYDLNSTTYKEYGYYSFGMGITITNGPNYPLTNYVWLLDVCEIGMNRAGYQKITVPATGQVFYRYMAGDKNVSSQTWTKKLMIEDYTEYIAENIDFNSYTAPGKYLIQTSSSHTNAPPAMEAMAELHVTTRSNGVVNQTVIYGISGQVFIRQKMANSNWNSWFAVNPYYANDMIHGADLQSSVNLNNYKTPGRYSFDTAVTFTNKPTGLAEGTGVVVLEFYLLTNNPSTGAGYQVLTHILDGKKWIRYVTGGLSSWRAWSEISDKASDYLNILITNPFVSLYRLKNRIARKQNQDIAVKDGHIFEFGVGAMSVDGSSTSISITNGHGNNAMFGEIYHGDFPYLYCGSWNTSDVCIYVNQVTTSSATLVRTISFPTLTGHLNMVVDEQNDRIYILMNKSESTLVGDIEFVVATLSTGEIISRNDLPFAIPVIQGMEFHNGLIYVTNGGDPSYKNNYILTLDTSGNLISRSDPIKYCGEVEGISFDDSQFYFANSTYIFY